MSSKFKMKLKLTGLELEIEGAREDIPMLMQNVGAQIAGQLAPAANIAAAKLPQQATRSAIEGHATAVTERGASRRRARKGAGPITAGGVDAGAIMTWTHDPNAWGNPLQDWKATDKAFWLLYVANKVGAASEMTAQQMVSTFDKLFRTSGKLNRGNIGRDFGKLASEPKAKIGSNGTVEPPTWYLTDAGLKHAEGLVLAARGEAPAT